MPAALSTGPCVPTGETTPAGDATAQVMEAWQRERPGVDATPLAVFSRVARLAKHLDQVRKAVLDRHNLQYWEFDVLAELRRAGEPYELTPGQMASAMLVSSGTMTNRIDRLETAGLVTRHADQQDGRVTWVRATAAGLAAIDAAMDDLLQRETELLAAIPAEARSQLALHLSHLLVGFESH